MENSIKTKFFNLLRQVFKISFFEQWLILIVKNKKSTSILYRLVPHSDTYSEFDYRVFTRNGIRIKVFLRDYLGHCLYFNYQNPELESYNILFSLIRKDSICVDVGSNIGFLSIGMASIAKNGYVYGFEPDPLNFKQASENLDLNKLPNVEIYNLGLGDVASEGVMDIQATENRGKNRVAPTGVGGDMITIVKLDDFLAEKGIDQISLVKIDVEGYEYKVLKGAENSLRKCLPLLFVEVDEKNLNDQGDTALELIDFLIAVGYNKLINAQTGQSINPSSNLTGLHFDLIATRENN